MIHKPQMHGYASNGHTNWRLNFHLNNSISLINSYNSIPAMPPTHSSSEPNVGVWESVEVLLRHTKIPESQEVLQPLLSIIQEKNVNLVLQRKGMSTDGEVSNSILYWCMGIIMLSCKPTYFLYCLGMENAISALWHQVCHLWEWPWQPYPPFWNQRKFMAAM